MSTSRSISPVLAIRWLRGEALRIADRLDPDPSHSPWLKRTPTPEPDAPTTLRTWANDPTTERRARDHLKNGHPLHVTAPDPDCTYTLSVWPVGRAAFGPDGTTGSAVPTSRSPPDSGARTKATTPPCHGSSRTTTAS
ncbi:hypothetical protein ACIQPQ_06755 [Streptomyces sp. NPDC091281]|uniref:hypothetical protein n=1 Tax=Streptomyces sp. NPDC091281 TaxID=3365985 RepID=UPI0037F8CFB8